MAKGDTNSNVKSVSLYGEIKKKTLFIKLTSFPDLFKINILN
jgi:hypothetical protein